MSEIIKEAKPVSAKQNAVAEKKKPQTLRDYVQIMMPEVKRALPSVITPERFSRIVLSAISNNPELQKCTPQSFLAAMMNAAQLGLQPNMPTGEAYLIPYKNKGQLECQFQIGYRGLLALAYRSGQVKTVYAEVVRENDEFSYALGLNPQLEHRPADKDRGEITYFYAVFKLTNGGEGFTVMSKADMDAHMRKFSKAAQAGFSPWQTNYEEMGKKTVIKRLLKMVPLSSDIQMNIAQDETIKSKIDADMSLINDEVENVEVIETDPDTGEVKDDSEK